MPTMLKWNVQIDTTQDKILLQRMSFYLQSRFSSMLNTISGISSLSCGVLIFMKAGSMCNGNNTFAPKEAVESQREMSSSCIFGYILK